MNFSEYENIEIFNNTQRFGINKCENQILRDCERAVKLNIQDSDSFFWTLMDQEKPD